MALNPALRSMVSQAKNKYKGGSGKTAKLKDGRNTLRILAPTPAQANWVPETGQFWADLGVHWIKADEKGKPIAVVGDCEIVHQRPSVINTAIAMAIESAMDEDSKELYESWKARKSVLVNALDRSANSSNEVFELTPTTFGKFLELLEIYADENVDITDMNEGIDIIITKTGKGLLTKYDMAVAAAKSVPVTQEQLDGAQDLTKFIDSNFFRGEEQKALNAIAQIAGVAVPALGNAGVSTPVAALTSAAATVADAAPVVAATVAAAAVVDPAVAEAAERRKALMAQQAAMAAELAAMDAPAATPAAATPVEETNTGLSQSDEDALLAELDALT